MWIIRLVSKKVLCYRNWWDAWPTRLHSRQACLQNQGSIHTGIVLNPAGSCAVRHEPYGVLDFRVAIDSLPCDKVAGFGRMSCLKFPFQVHFFEAVGRSFILHKIRRNLSRKSALCKNVHRFRSANFEGFRDVRNGKWCEKSK